jgi:spore coat polysaccharide biosynthesis protein SpsF
LKAKSAIAIIQARMSSQRLPGKVLMPLNGKPMIAQIVERASSCQRINKTIVATSTESSDDELAEYCSNSGIGVFRGSLNNVLSRFTSILRLHPHTYVVRITGDCPLIDPHFIDAQIGALEQFNGDLVIADAESSVLVGQGVLSSNAIMKVEEGSLDPIDSEHVGSNYLLTHADQFRYVKFILPSQYKGLDFRLTVDELPDYILLERIFSRKWKSDPIDLREVLRWLRSESGKQQENFDVPDSAVNTEMKEKRKIFSPEIVGAYKWEI